ncbi:MAG: DUF3185 family protein [Alcanivoracaceae bacterium]
MTMRHTLGIVLLMTGAALVFFSCRASQVFAEQADKIFAGQLASETTWYFFDGVTASLLGLVMLATRNSTRL